MIPVTSTIQGTCTVQSHYIRGSYSVENIEGVQVATCKHWIHVEEKRNTFVKVASFNKFTAENSVGQYTLAHIYILCPLYMYQFEVWS